MKEPDWRYKLAAHIRQLPPPEHLLALAREIGFEAEASELLIKRQRIHVVSPELATREHTTDVHAQVTQRKRWSWLSCCCCA